MLFKWPRHGLSCLLLIATLLTGCGYGNPYVEPGVDRPGILRAESGHPIQPTYVSVAVAREYARFLQDAYREAAGGHSQLRRVLDAGLIGTAMAALGVAFVADAPDIAGLLGLSAAGVGYYGDRYLNTQYSRIYFTGALALECIISRSNRHMLLDLGTYTVQISYQSLRDTADAYRTAIQQFADAVKHADRTKPKEIREDATWQRTLQETGQYRDQQLKEAEAIRFRVEAATALMQAQDPLGQILLSKIENIRLQVDAQVARQEPDRVALDEGLRRTLAGGYGFAGTFTVPDSDHTSLTIKSNSAEPNIMPAVLNSYSAMREARNNFQDAQKTFNSVVRTHAERQQEVPDEIFSDCTSALMRTDPPVLMGPGPADAHERLEV